jgi:hypothetical protein
MLSFLSKKDKNPQSTLAVIATEQSTLARQREVVRLEGMKEAEQRLASMFKLPDISATNVIATATTLSGASVEIYSAWTGDDKTLDTSAIIYAGFNLAFSQASQVYKLLNAYFQNRKTLDMFINALPLDQIERCYFEDPKTKEPIVVPTPLSAEKIREFMKKHGSVTVQLIGRDHTFVLNDLSFLTFRVGGTLVAGTAVSLLSTGLFIGSRISDPDNDPNTLPIYTAGAVASTIPFTTIFSSLLSICNNQQVNLSRGINTVLSMYEDDEQLTQMPEEFIAVLDRYIDPETMLKNRKKIEELRKNRDLELGPVRTSRLHNVI